ncbi:MAG: sodium:alanine symporter family protein [Erysipelotrichaceae bacterium]|nr:sodium:alanine symporter family protein [Erysipelotrichaceae bacterium]
MVEKLMYINTQINGIVWGKYMLCFLLLIGIFLNVRTKGFAFFKWGLIYRTTIGSLFQKKEKKQGVTSFQAVSTALAGTLGVGSIIGVTTALTLGGAGSLFWMWISALLGMIIKYAEVVLAIHFRRRTGKDTYVGGPMTTLEYGCRLPFLGVLFSLFCIFASFGIGNLTPANTIAHTIQEYIPLSSFWIGIGIAVLIAIIILGKSQKIMKINEITIPVISIVYILACLYLLVCNIEQLPQAVSSIFQEAFTFSSGVGGVAGYGVTRAMHYGVSRGVFSNEAGMGSAPIAHACVANVHPVEQGFWGIFEVFFDTIIVCTITGLVVLTSGLMQSGMEGVALSVACFRQGFGDIGGMLFAFSIVSFAIPSIIGWYYYASECIRYLFQTPFMLKLYQIIFLGLLILGACMELQYAWEIADTLNGLMSIPNLLSLIILQKVVVKLTKEYMQAHRSG